MNGTAQLTESELGQLVSVISRHPDVERVVLFGSRAKGVAAPNSDIDLAVYGPRNDLRIEAIAAELDALPLPYRFDVVAGDLIRYEPLRDHIDRVGVTVFARE